MHNIHLKNNIALSCIHCLFTFMLSLPMALIYIAVVCDDDVDNNLPNACSISYTLLARPAMAMDNIVLESVPEL